MTLFIATARVLFILLIAGAVLTTFRYTPRKCREILVE